MNIYRLMVSLGIILIAVGLYGAMGTVEESPQSQNILRIREQTSRHILSRFGQDFGKTGGVIALVVGGIVVVVGVVGCIKGWDEPDGPR